MLGIALLTFLSKLKQVGQNPQSLRAPSPHSHVCTSISAFPLGPQMGSPAPAKSRLPLSTRILHLFLLKGQHTATLTFLPYILSLVPPMWPCYFSYLKTKPSLDPTPLLVSHHHFFASFCSKILQRVVCIHLLQLLSSRAVSTEITVASKLTILAVNSSDLTHDRYLTVDNFGLFKTPSYLASTSRHCSLHFCPPWCSLLSVSFLAHLLLDFLYWETQSLDQFYFLSPSTGD